jgi:N-acetyl-gamma-glutamyl-phosphate reductase
MLRAAVIGATGYAGAELVRILSGHPEASLSVITSRQYDGERFDRVFPSMTGHVDLICENLSADDLYDRADLFFLSVPHKIPMEIVPELISKGKRVIDLSADFRFRDSATYEAYYQPHTSKYLLEKAVYGLSEIYHNEIKNADLIGNPGCYPTSVLLPLIPLLKEGFLDADSIVADSKSGVSGAGRTLSLSTHFCEVNESFKAYKVASHRHNPEIEEILSRETGRKTCITFVPHLVPMTRGMLTTIYARLKTGVTPEKIRDSLSSFYAGRKFIRICDDKRLPDTKYVAGTNYCDIGFRIDSRTGCLILISAIDNLVKGAAGQAVQNMNIMFGFKETEGLMSVPYPV